MKTPVEKILNNPNLYVTFFFVLLMQGLNVNWQMSHYTQVLLFVEKFSLGYRLFLLKQL